jgi:hypothetical protein
VVCKAVEPPQLIDGYFKSDGSLTKKSEQLLASKMPLHGESGDLEWLIYQYNL